MTQSISCRLVPSLQRPLGVPALDDIGSIPAVHLKLTLGDHDVPCIGVIDTAADISTIDESILSQFPEYTRLYNDLPILVVDLSGHAVRVFHFDLTLIGDDGESFQLVDVPAMSMRIGRSLFKMGMRRMLERLDINISFSEMNLRLTLPQLDRKRFPNLNREFTSLGLIESTFEKGASFEAILRVSWELERFLDRILRNDPSLQELAVAGLGRRSLGDQLSLVQRVKGSDETWKSIETIVVTRNQAAHGVLPDDFGRQAFDAFLLAAERVVARYSLESTETMHSFVLTAEETELLRRLAGGAKLKYVAMELAISVDAARRRARRIYEKMGTTNLSDAIAIARTSGLLDSGSDSAALGRLR
jgi:DNA-binding CsgD family transcriptional regulator